MLCLINSDLLNHVAFRICCIGRNILSSKHLVMSSRAHAMINEVKDPGPDEGDSSSSHPCEVVAIDSAHNMRSYVELYGFALTWYPLPDDYLSILCSCTGCSHAGACICYFLQSIGSWLCRHSPLSRLYPLRCCTWPTI